MARNIILVGFAGQIGCGKSAAAAHLIGQGFTVHKMAGPLKNMLRAIGLDDDHIEGHLKQVPCGLLCGKTPREAMITLGTEWGRDMIGPDIWTRAWGATLPPGNVVCDDVRFANEVDAIHRAGGTVIRIVRGDLAPASHVSEAQDFEVDRTIYNDGTLAELFKSIDLALT